MCFKINQNLLDYTLIEHSKITPRNALELVCEEYFLRNSGKTIEKLVDLKLGSGDFREILKDGDRIKKGTLSARGLAPWEDLKKEVDETLKSGYALLNKMKADPDSFNTPLFGPCNACPYHNVEVEYNGQKIRCTG